MSVEPTKLTRQTFRVAIKPDHPEADGKSEQIVDGFVSPSGVFGIDRRIDIERQAKAANDDLDDSGQLWIVTHIPTGMRVGFQLSFEAAHRNLDLLEPHADEMNAGEFGQTSADLFPQSDRGRLAWAVSLADHAAAMEFEA